MKRLIILFLALSLLPVTSCTDVLDPEPVDLLIDDLVLNEPADVRNVEIGLYNAFRNILPSTVIAGDFTADMLSNNGTFTNFRELGTKQITSANASVAALWNSIYGTIYIANFILEKLPEVPGVPSTQRQTVTATAHFLRGYAYFIGVYTYGGIPLVTTTSIETNRNIPRSSKEEILDFVLDDYMAALDKLPKFSQIPDPSTTGFATDHAVRAALARYYLYAEEWALAESYATSVISTNVFRLDTLFSYVVNRDFPLESIFEVGYTIQDDPGTDNTIGLNNLFVGRREIIPSNEVVRALDSTRTESGGRFSSITFSSNDLSGSDNGWSVAKYGTADADNNNVMVFRLAEMYLIRAEARMQQNKVTGPNSAQSDINVLRTRAKAPLVPEVSKTQMQVIIENERRFELAFEGHRWYDLVRTGRVTEVMSNFSANWKSAYERWPIPQREILNNPSLAGHQNPGY